MFITEKWKHTNNIFLKWCICKFTFCITKLFNKCENALKNVSIQIILLLYDQKT